MDFENGVKNIQAAAYNGARTVSKCQNHEEDCTNFCGLVRKAELY